MTNAILSLLAVQFNNASVKKLAELITKEEWAAKQLSKETQKSIGLRSPKLSKALLALGVPQKHVAAALSATGSTEPTEIFGIDNDPEGWFVWNQQSAHFFSCQHEGSGFDQRWDDILDYEDKVLFFWVAGGRELKARAKVRVMHPQSRDCIYLYVDRPYGQHAMLLDDLDRLEAFGQQLAADRDTEFAGVLFPPVWKREEGKGSNFQETYGGRFPIDLWTEAYSGYQDTLSPNCPGPYNFFVAPNNEKSLVKEMYKARRKEGGVYLHSLSEGLYNPQDMTCRYPEIKDRKAKPRLSPAAAETMNSLVRELVRKHGPVESVFVNSDSLTRTAWWEISFKHGCVKAHQCNFGRPYATEVVEAVDWNPGFYHELECKLRLVAGAPRFSAVEAWEAYSFDSYSF